MAGSCTVSFPRGTGAPATDLPFRTPTHPQQETSTARRTLPPITQDGELRIYAASHDGEPDVSRNADGATLCGMDRPTPRLPTPPSPPSSRRRGRSARSRSVGSSSTSSLTSPTRRCVSSNVEKRRSSDCVIDYSSWRYVCLNWRFREDVDSGELGNLSSSTPVPAAGSSAVSSASPWA